MSAASMSGPMPVVFLGHGSPMNAIEDNAWRRGWAEVAKLLPRAGRTLIIYAAIVAAAAVIYQRLPTSFLPNEDQGNLLDASTAGLFSNPFKLTSTSSMAYAGTVGDAFGKLMGAHRRASGARDPLVYIHRLAYGSPDTGTLCGWTRAGHYGRMTSQPRFTDRFGRDTGAEHGSVYVGENVLIEGEL